MNASPTHLRRVVATCLLLAAAGGCGSSNGGSSGGTHPATPAAFLPPGRVVSELNRDLPGTTFSETKAYTNQTNIAAGDDTYGHFTVIVAKPGHPLSDYTWGKDHLDFSRRGESGDLFAYGSGIPGGSCDFVIGYPGNVGMIWLVDTSKPSCHGLRPHGNNWAIVNQTLSNLH